MLPRFARWFSSRGGVWQTTGFVALVVLGEYAGWLRDPRGSWFMYWLTVYSAVTQPVLAYANRIEAERTDRVLARMESLECAILAGVEELDDDDEDDTEASAAGEVPASRTAGGTP